MLYVHAVHAVLVSLWVVGSMCMSCTHVVCLQMVVWCTCVRVFYCMCCMHICMSGGGAGGDVSLCVCVCVCVCGVCLGLALAFCIPAWPCARSFLLRKHLLNCPAEKQTDASPPEIHLPHQLHESRIVPHPARGPPEVEPLLKGLRLVSGGTRIQTWVF